MAVLLGLLVAVSYGSADFFGGMSAKRVSVTAVVVISQTMGLPWLAVLVVVAGGDPTANALVLGCAAGVVGGIGLSCLYGGLAGGRMSVVAPITSVGAAIVPVFWGLSQGERPGPLAMVGIAVAVLAVGLITRTADEALDGTHATGDTAARFVVMAVIAGAAFGTVFVLLSETGDDAGFWPLVAGRLTSVVLLGLAGVARRQQFRPGSAGVLVWMAAAGVLDMTANALYLLASRRGLLALVAVLSSLYPAVTVLLARLVLKERLARIQLAGLGLAGAGILLIATG